MTSSILKEIEELHKFLEQKEYEPYQPITHSEQRTPAPPPVPAAQASIYRSHGIQSAEKNVDKLGLAIEAAEHEMEAALRRTSEVHKNQLRQKEVELSELQRQMVAKDRCIDGLRETLATTKRTYEGRLAQLEEALGTKTAQVAALSQEVKVAATEREAAAAHLNRAAALHEQEVTQRAEQQRVFFEHQIAELRAANSELSHTARIRADEATRAQAAINAERAELSRASRDVLELRRQVEALNDKLLVARVEGRTEKEQLAAKVEDLRKRLKAERGLRKSCERWMRSELKSREEMELLLGVVKDAAGKDGSSVPHVPGLPLYAQEDSEVRGLLAKMSRLHGASLSPSPTKPALLGHSHLHPRDHDQHAPTRHQETRREHHYPTQHPSASMPPHTPHSQVAELSSLHRQAAEDNHRLRAELAASKRLMTERIRGF